MLQIKQSVLEVVLQLVLLAPCRTPCHIIQPIIILHRLKPVLQAIINPTWPPGVVLEEEVLELMEEMEM